MEPFYFASINFVIYFSLIMHTFKKKLQWNKIINLIESQKVFKTFLWKPNKYSQTINKNLVKTANNH